jgi:hypothetical protein
MEKFLLIMVVARSAMIFVGDLYKNYMGTMQKEKELSVTPCPMIVEMPKRFLIKNL